MTESSNTELGKVCVSMWVFVWCVYVWIDMCETILDKVRLHLFYHIRKNIYIISDPFNPKPKLFIINYL
jgi:hypothetical protein